METIYQRLLWLDIGQAIAYLKTFTTAPVTERLLLQLCELGDCTAYIDATGLEGIALCNELTRVSGWRHQEIISPSFFETGGEEGLAPRFVKGSYSLRPLPGQGEEDGFGLWEIGMYPPDAPIAKALLRFKPADIQALAVKTNKATEPYSSSATELESLLQQLEDERNKRKVAEQRAEHAEAEAKPSHLLAIAALLELLKSPVDRPRPQGMNQTAIMDEILKRFPLRGLKDRNLQKFFARANEAMADAKLNAE